MSLDPVKTEDVKAWLGKVVQDLRIAELCLEAAPPLIEGSLFHSQQAVEKIFKAFLTWHDEVFKKTHDLVTLGRQVSKIDSSLTGGGTFKSAHLRRDGPNPCTIFGALRCGQLGA